MSLESQITALVSAANKLTSEVANKMKGIDQSVASAVRAIPELHKAIYLSIGVGNDENTGTAASPIKTLKEAVNRIPENGSGVIYLAAGETYRFTENVAFNSKTIMFSKTDKNSVSNTNPLIVLNAYEDATLGWSEAYGLRATSNAVVKVVAVDVDTGSFAGVATKHRGSPCGLVSRNHFQGNTAFIDFSAYDSRMIIRDHPAITLFGHVRVSLSAVQREYVGAANQFANASVFSIYEQAVSDSNSELTFTDIYKGAKLDGTNILTNVNLS